MTRLHFLTAFRLRFLKDGMDWPWVQQVHVSKQDTRQGRDLKHKGKTERDQQRDVETRQHPGPHKCGGV